MPRYTTNLNLVSRLSSSPLSHVTHHNLRSSIFDEQITERVSREIVRSCSTHTARKMLLFSGDPSRGVVHRTPCARSFAFIRGIHETQSFTRCWDYVTRSASPPRKDTRLIISVPFPRCKSFDFPRVLCSRWSTRIRVWFLTLRTVSSSSFSLFLSLFPRPSPI